MANRALRSWRPDAPALMGYLLLVVAANVASTHWPPLVIGGLHVPVGTAFAGAGLTARDLVHDNLGPRGVTAGILAGAGLSAWCASPQIAAASAVAFTASEIVDALIYTKLRHRSRLGAVTASNAGGLVVDSALFVPLAFGSLTAVPGQLLGKTVATLLTLAVLHTARVIARRAVTRP
ncbi:VUT family protein [Actinokineospora sp. NPDC004072]